MRDVVIVLIYASALGFAVWKRSPFVGILVYFWVSFMNPHRFSWGFAYYLPLAMGAFAVTFMTIVLNFGEIKWPRAKETYLFLLLWIFITITTFLAMYPELAMEKWSVINKILLTTLLSMLIVNTKNRLIIFLFAIVIFIGLVGVKGAIFGVLTGGKYRFWGPPESFLEDNNGLGLALVMILPLCLFLKDLFVKKWQRLGLFGIAGALAISIVLTYSRGALVGLAIVTMYYVAFSKYKFRVAAATIVVLTIAALILPPEWFGRMNTMKDVGEDKSANMRFNSWMMSINIAKEFPLGAGLECFSLENYERFSPNPDLGAATQDGEVVGSTAHSIYFQILATQGFGGLALYLIVIFSILFSLLRLSRLGKKLPSGEWITITSRGIIGSMLGFMASGAFLSLAFFDLYWALFGAGICLKSIVYSGQWQYEEQLPFLRS